MLEINHTLLSHEALNNLVIDVITRQSTDYGDYELDIEQKKLQLMHQLESGKAVIVYCHKQDACDIIKTELFRATFASEISFCE